MFWLVALHEPGGIDSATHAAKEDAMAERTSIPTNGEPEATLSDPGDGSTWSTIEGTAELGDLMNEDDLEDFLVEPISDPLADPFDRSNS